MRRAVFLVLLALLVQPAQAAPKPAPATISSDQATEIIWKLPEVKAWSAYILRTTQEKVHPALMVQPEEPVRVE